MTVEKQQQQQKKEDDLCRNIADHGIVYSNVCTHRLNNVVFNMHSPGFLVKYLIPFHNAKHHHKCCILCRLCAQGGQWVGGFSGETTSDASFRGYDSYSLIYKEAKW